MSSIHSCAMAFLISLVATGCLSSQVTQDPVPSISKKTGSSIAKPGPLKGKPLSALLLEIQRIEIEFARDNCKGVMDNSSSLLSKMNSKGALQLPLSTRVAMSVCASKTNPKHDSQSKSAILYLNEALRSLTPLWSPLAIQERKAERLESSGKLSEAASVRRAILVQLEADTRVREKNELAIIRLSEEFQQLTEQERDQLRRLVSDSFQSGRLFSTLEKIEVAASTNSKPEYKQALRSIKERIVSRIEFEFSKGTTKLIVAFKSNDSSETRSAEYELRRKFSKPTYQKRIDALIQALKSESEEDGTMTLSRSQPAEDNSEFSSMSQDEKISTARSFINSGRPDKAVRVLRSIPEGTATGQATQLLNEAISIHIREIRLRVRDLFKRAEGRSSPQEKRADYEQCLELLRFITSEYPETRHRRSVERNIRNIENKIELIND